MNQIFKFQEYNINILGTQDKPMFFGSQIATALGYMKPRNAVSIHIWESNKINYHHIIRYAPIQGVRWIYIQIQQL